MKNASPKPCSINSFSAAPTWFTSLTSAKVFPKTFLYLHTVMKDFFGIQFLRKFHILKTPLLHVDNELDKKVPFTPEHIGDYLGFVNFWIRPLGMLVKVLGRRKAVPYLAQFFELLALSYKEAASVYRYCMTTTDRPRYNKKAYFVMVHIFDPHYLCVPSLHIAVVSLCAAFFKSVLQREEFSDEQRKLWTQEIYDGAVKIAETVLYVKQHSVNCIPAALYMMTKIIPQYFKSSDAEKFLDDMFVTRKDIPQNDRLKTAGYMKKLFARFEKGSKNTSDWAEPVRTWMKEYAEKTGQNHLFFNGK